LEVNGEFEITCKKTGITSYINIEYGGKFKGYVLKNNEKLFDIDGIFLFKKKR
jgi:hypothetical protein